MFNDDGFSFFPVEPNCTFVVTEEPFDEQYDDDFVETIWQEGKKELGNALFEGAAARLYSYTPERIEIQFISYKLFYAWNIALRSSISLQPIGMSGITKYRDCFLIGLRSNKVAHNRGLFECVPSGSVDDHAGPVSNHIDLQELVQRELFEEAKIASSFILDISTLGLFWDKKEEVWDIVYTIRLKEGNDIDLVKKTDEYAALYWMSKTELVGHIHAFPNQYVSLTKWLFTNKIA